MTLLTESAGRAARIAWPLVAAALAALTCLSLPAAIAAARTPTLLHELPSWRMSEQQLVAALVLIDLAPVVVYFAVCATIWWRARATSMALACAYLLAAFGTFAVGPFGALAPAAGPAAVLVAIGGAVGQLAAATFLFLFPTGTLRLRPFGWVLLAGALVLLGLIVPDLLMGRAATADAVQTVGMLLFLVGVVAQAVRYRRLRDPKERAQVRWVVYGLAVTAAVLVASRVLVVLLPAAVQRSEVAAALLGGGSFALALAVVPVCVGIAVLRGGLWDVDRVVNRTLVAGLLSVLVVAIYVTVVTYLGAQIRTPSLVASLTGTGVVAVLVQPLQRLLQRAVNRLMFGLRDEPAAVVTELGRRLEAVADADAVLGASAETLARALRLPFVEVRLRDGRRVARGTPSPQAAAVPLVFQGRPVGELALAGRRPGEPLGSRDLALVSQVTPQIAAAGHALLLTSDLRASRARIVEAREDERRRIRRDLHDGLGPALAGLALQASTVAEVARNDSDQAGVLAENVATGIRRVIADVRRLVYGLRPPALDELGLVGGLRSVADSLEMPGRFRIRIDAPDPLPLLPAGIEAAVYRIAGEAMANAARHADAADCSVRISVDEAVRVEVTDDGIGIPGGVTPGVGILSMRERAAEVGGTVEVSPAAVRGTVVTVRLPLTAAVVEPVTEPVAEPA